MSRVCAAIALFLHLVVLLAAAPSRCWSATERCVPFDIASSSPIALAAAGDNLVVFEKPHNGSGQLFLVGRNGCGSLIGGFPWMPSSAKSSVPPQPRITNVTSPIESLLSKPRRLAPDIAMLAGFSAGFVAIELGGRKVARYAMDERLGAISEVPVATAESSMRFTRVALSTSRAIFAVVCDVQGDADDVLPACFVAQIQQVPFRAVCGNTSTMAQLRRWKLECALAAASLTLHDCVRLRAGAAASFSISPSALAAANDDTIFVADDVLRVIFKCAVIAAADAASCTRFFVDPIVGKGPLAVEGRHADSLLIADGSRVWRFDGRLGLKTLLWSSEGDNSTMAVVAMSLRRHAVDNDELALLVVSRNNQTTIIIAHVNATIDVPLSGDDGDVAFLCDEENTALVGDRTLPVVAVMLNPNNGIVARSSGPAMPIAALGRNGSIVVGALGRLFHIQLSSNSTDRCVAVTTVAGGGAVNHSTSCPRTFSPPLATQRDLDTTPPSFSAVSDELLLFPTQNGVVLSVNRSERRLEVLVGSGVPYGCGLQDGPLTNPADWLIHSVALLGGGGTASTILFGVVQGKKEEGNASCFGLAAWPWRAGARSVPELILGSPELLVRNDNSSAVVLHHAVACIAARPSSLARWNRGAQILFGLGDSIFTLQATSPAAPPALLHRLSSAASFSGHVVRALSVVEAADPAKGHIYVVVGHPNALLISGTIVALDVDRAMFPPAVNERILLASSAGLHFTDIAAVVVGAITGRVNLFITDITQLRVLRMVDNMTDVQQHRADQRDVDLTLRSAPPVDPLAAFVADGSHVRSISVTPNGTLLVSRGGSYIAQARRDGALCGNALDGPPFMDILFVSAVNDTTVVVYDDNSLTVRFVTEGRIQSIQGGGVAFRMSQAPPAFPSRPTAVALSGTCAQTVVAPPRLHVAFEVKSLWTVDTGSGAVTVVALPGGAVSSMASDPLSSRLFLADPTSDQVWIFSASTFTPLFPLTLPETNSSCSATGAATAQSGYVSVVTNARLRCNLTTHRLRSPTAIATGVKRGLNSTLEIVLFISSGLDASIWRVGLAAADAEFVAALTTTNPRDLFVEWLTARSLALAHDGGALFIALPDRVLRVELRNNATKPCGSQLPVDPDLPRTQSLSMSLATVTETTTFDATTEAPEPTLSLSAGSSTPIRLLEPRMINVTVTATNGPLAGRINVLLTLSAAAASFLWFDSAGCALTAVGAVGCTTEVPVMPRNGGSSSQSPAFIFTRQFLVAVMRDTGEGANLTINARADVLSANGAAVSWSDSASRTLLPLTPRHRVSSVTPNMGNVTWGAVVTIVGENLDTAPFFAMLGPFALQVELRSDTVAALSLLPATSGLPTFPAPCATYALVLQFTADVIAAHTSPEAALICAALTAGAVVQQQLCAMSPMYPRLQPWQFLLSMFDATVRVAPNVVLERCDPVGTIQQFRFRWACNLTYESASTLAFQPVFGVVDVESSSAAPVGPIVAELIAAARPPNSRRYVATFAISLMTQPPWQHAIQLRVSHEEYFYFYERTTTPPQALRPDVVVRRGIGFTAQVEIRGLAFFELLFNLTASRPPQNSTARVIPVSSPNCDFLLNGRAVACRGASEHDAGSGDPGSVERPLVHVLTIMAIAASDDESVVPVVMSLTSRGVDVLSLIGGEELSHFNLENSPDNASVITPAPPPLTPAPVRPRETAAPDHQEPKWLLDNQYYGGPHYAWLAGFVYFPLLIAIEIYTQLRDKFAPRIVNRPTTLLSCLARHHTVFGALRPCTYRCACVHLTKLFVTVQVVYVAIAGLTIFWSPKASAWGTAALIGFVAWAFDAALRPSWSHLFFRCEYVRAPRGTARVYRYRDSSDNGDAFFNSPAAPPAAAIAGDPQMEEGDDASPAVAISGPNYRPTIKRVRRYRNGAYFVAILVVLVCCVGHYFTSLELRDDAAKFVQVSFGFAALFGVCVVDPVYVALVYVARRVFKADAVPRRFLHPVDGDECTTSQQLGLRRVAPEWSVAAKSIPATVAVDLDS